jgi:hypothetical protein
MRKAGLAKPGDGPAAIMSNPERVREGLMKVWGWSADDVAKYYDPGSRPGIAGGKARLTTKVHYISSREELASYALKLGSTLIHGRPPKPLDTTSMVSKASGPGWGIFVMDGYGDVYVGQHRVGLFHHSSFNAGGGVAAAGEMQAVNGSLKSITAKSGHYTPTIKQTRQLLHRLAAAGCPLAGVTCKVWVEDRRTKFKTLIYDAADLLKNDDKATVLKEEGMM